MLHPFPPVFDSHSSVLILGTFPSVKSREHGFFYGHPQNRFWKLMTVLTKSLRIPKSIDEKKEMLVKNKIAIWDTIYSCDIEGSKDVSIKNVIPNDLSIILEAADIKQIYANGRISYEIYMKYCYHNTKREIIKLPSSSPANATYNFEKLKSTWEQIIIT